MRIALFLVLVSSHFAGSVRAEDAPRFEIDAPPVLLRGVPVRRVEIRALAANGELDESFDETVDVEGLELRDGDDVVPFPPFHAGRLVLPFDGDRVESNREKQRTLHATGGPIVVAAGTGDEARATPTLVPGWVSLVPPVIAIVLAIWWRQVLAALFLGILGGALVLVQGDPLAALRMSLSEFVVQAIVDPDGGAYSHVHVILFTTFLGSMVAVMFASGGTTALVGTLRPWLHTRERTQLGTTLLGIVVFFDDYANSLLVGTTMRPVTDRQRISREKLAFLVDATAAPIAGLAIVSTWVGFEIGLIQQAFADLGLETNGVYGTFIATLPYRFYPLLLLVFVVAVAWTGRDFGPMLRAERRALETGATSRPGANVPDLPDERGPVNASSRTSAPRVVNAALPLGFLLVAITVGLYWTGTAGLATSNAKLVAAGEAAEPATLANLLSNANSYVVLLYASFLASILAVGCAIVTRGATPNEAANAWVEGIKQMLPAVIVLILAWALAKVCDGEHLDTAGYLVAATTGWVSAEWMPTLAFLLAAGVSFATGTSWATMGLLIPLFIPYTYELVGGGEAADPNGPLMLGTIGAVLAGAIFGDHCSPISDTTVLSSAASGCDHLDHVGTQLPYALTVAAICLVTCSAPLAFGVSPWVGLAAGVVATIAVVRFGGRRAAK